MPPTPKKRWTFLPTNRRIRMHAEKKSGISPAVSLAISVLALSASFASLYYSALRPSHLRIMTGEYVELMTWKEGNLVVQVNFALSNSGTRSVVVRRLALSLSPDENAAKEIIIPPYEYVSQESQTIRGSGAVVPEVIKGGETVFRYIRFVSYADWKEILGELEQKRYRLSCLAWIEGSDDPMVISTDIIAIDRWASDRIGVHGMVAPLQVERWRRGNLFR
jgi:hypothetical protein